MIETKHCVVLLSGGLDSTTTAAIAKSEGFVCHALTFNYGQRNKWEIEAAKGVARSLGITDHRVLKIDLRVIGGSALTSETPVPKSRKLSEMSRDIPVTYVPARNTIFLSFALGLAETISAHDIFIGVNAIDYSGYPDCRPEFIEAFEHVANLATKAGVQGKVKFKIHTPLIRLSKTEIIKRGVSLGVDYSITKSCYDPGPNGEACGQCDACLLRQRGFAGAGIVDPALRVMRSPQAT